MSHYHPFSQLLFARLREFYREPEAVFWVYGFPLIMAIGLGIAFGNRQPTPSSVDVQQSPNEVLSNKIEELLTTAGLKATIQDEAACRERLRTGKTELYIVPSESELRYIYDPTRPESVVARSQVDNVLVRWKADIHSDKQTSDDGERHTYESLRRDHATIAWQTVDIPIMEPGNRYIDFLIPGLIGLNIMGGGLWGVGFVIVDMRVRKLLKRLLATPMRRSHFLFAILGARLAMLIPEMTLLLTAAWLGFGMPMRGHLLTLGLTLVLGAAAFAGIGLVLASRTEKSETISGLINLVMLPMWLLSGTFFSSRRFPDAIQPFIQALPLTQLNDALREVILEGASVVQILGRLAILTIWGAPAFLLALKWFRWN